MTPSTDTTRFEGEKIDLTATAKSGYKLIGWFIGNNSDPISEAENYSFEIPSGENYVSAITITAKFGVSPSEIEEGINPERYGKFVHYNIDLGIDGNFDARDDGVDDDWRILYEDSKNIYIIAADFVSTENEYLAEAMTKMNASVGIYYGSYRYPYCLMKKQNESLKTYKDSSTPTDAVSSNDIFVNRPEGTAFFVNKGFLSFWKNVLGDTAYGGEGVRMTACFMDTKIWEGFAGGLSDTILQRLPENDKNVYAIGGPTLSLFVESWNARYPNEKLYYNGVSSKGYYFGNKTNPTSYRIEKEEMTIMQGYNDTLYFNRHNSYNSASGYRLATTSAAGYEYSLAVRVEGLLDWVRQDAHYVGVRPVVCLPSSVKLVKSSKINNLYEITTKDVDE